MDPTTPPAATLSSALAEISADPGAADQRTWLQRSASVADALADACRALGRDAIGAGQWVFYCGDTWSPRAARTVSLPYLADVQLGYQTGVLDRTGAGDERFLFDDFRVRYNAATVTDHDTFTKALPELLRALAAARAGRAEVAKAHSQYLDGVIREITQPPATTPPTPAS